MNAVKLQHNPMMNVALVGVFAALITAFSLVPGINIPGSSVPITLQTLAVCLTALIIGPLRAAAATTLYLLMGLAGLPVFAGGASGIGVLAKASAGYLLSFPLYALIVGFVAQWIMRRRLKVSVLWLFLAGLVGSILVIHPFGIVGMSVNIPVPFAKAVAFDIVYWPGDVLKTLITASVAAAVHAAFPQLLAVGGLKPATAAAN